MQKVFAGDYYAGLCALSRHLTVYRPQPQNKEWNKACPDPNGDNVITKEEFKTWYNDYYAPTFNKTHKDCRLPRIYNDNDACDFLKAIETAAKEKAKEKPQLMSSKKGVEEDFMLKDSEIQLALFEYEDKDQTNGN